MAIKSILKGIGLGVGAGAGAMYLGNEGEGETFTSYPRDARYKRLLRGEDIPLPGLEDYVYGEGKYSQSKDRFGFGTEADARREVTDSQTDLWKNFTSLPIDSDEFKSFSKSSLQDKIAMLHTYANDTDDALWRSKEWQDIVAKSGEDEMKAHSGYWNQRESLANSNITSDKGISFGLPKDTGQVY